MSNNGTPPSPQIVIFEKDSVVIDVQPGLITFGSTIHTRQLTGFDRDGQRWSFKRNDHVLPTGGIIPGYLYDFVALAPSESE
ncbi:MAG: hypothetical protein JXQ72_16560 [Anaerolineae bacterium]|nr:hypothetical protein [Anaerolineae bacterium]